jgi:hypothetical protein
MTNTELLEAFNVNYEAHAMIQQIIQNYKLRIENDQQN